MVILKAIQWLLGLAITFYLYKALLGKLRNGEGLRKSIGSDTIKNASSSITAVPLDSRLRGNDDEFA